MTNGQNKSKPHTILKVVVFLVVIALVIVAAYFVFSITKDNHSRSILSDNVNSLKLELSRAGLGYKDNNYCDRPVEGFGEGPKRCYISVISSFKVDSIASANTYMSKYSDVLLSQQWLTGTRAFPEVLPHVLNGIDFAGVGFGSRNTGSYCSAKYVFDLSRNNLSITFMCDNTSWLTKFFEG